MLLKIISIKWSFHASDLMQFGLSLFKSQSFEFFELFLLYYVLWFDFQHFGELFVLKFLKLSLFFSSESDLIFDVLFLFLFQFLAKFFFLNHLFLMVYSFLLHLKRLHFFILTLDTFSLHFFLFEPFNKTPRFLALFLSCLCWLLRLISHKSHFSEGLTYNSQLCFYLFHVIPSSCKAVINDI